MKAFRPLLLALRAALIATAVFWVALQVVDRLGWQAPHGATEPAIFFVVFFFGLLMSGKG